MKSVSFSIEESFKIPKVYRVLNRGIFQSENTWKKLKILAWISRKKLKSKLGLNSEFLLKDPSFFSDI